MAHVLDVVHRWLLAKRYAGRVDIVPHGNMINASTGVTQISVS